MAAQIVADQMHVATDAGVDLQVVLFVDRLDDVADAFAHAFWRDAVGGVVGLLPFAPPVGLAEGIV